MRQAAGQLTAREAAAYLSGRGRVWLPAWLTSEHPFPWLAPASAMMIVFGIYPLLYAFWLSLHKRNPVLRKNVFDPAYNWMKALADDRVWHAMVTTFTYTAIAIVF